MNTVSRLEPGQEVSVYVTQLSQSAIKLALLYSAQVCGVSKKTLTVDSPGYTVLIQTAETVRTSPIAAAV